MFFPRYNNGIIHGIVKQFIQVQKNRVEFLLYHLTTVLHKRHRFSPSVEKIPWTRKWQGTPGFLPGNFHGQRSLASYSPWGRKELDAPEHVLAGTQIRDCTIFPSSVHFLTLLNNYSRAFLPSDSQYFPFLTFG